MLLFTGCVLGGIAIPDLVKVRQIFRATGRSSKKFERLMTRLGIFVMFYTLPVLGTLICTIREAQIRPEWRTSGLLTALDCRSSKNCLSEPMYKDASLEIVLLRIFLTFAIGVASGMWVWSGKTCRAWSRLLAVPSKPNVRPTHQIQHNPFPFTAYKQDAVNIA